MRRQLSPFGAVFRGLLAGVAGAAVQDLFLRATAKRAPTVPKEAFSPSEPAQKDEIATQTVARRLAEAAGVGPLTDEQKQRGATLVHYGFGGLWGAAYGLQRESISALSRPAGVAVYATQVWGVSDNVLLPAFKLAAWPHRYPAKVHAFAWLAHLVYAAGVAGSYALLRRSRLLPVLASGWLLITRVRLQRRLPGALRPAAKAAFGAITPAVLAAARLKNSAVRL